MTTPKVATVYRGGSRFYVHPETREQVPGVTSILNQLPKPFLKAWAGKLVAETAVDNAETIAQIVKTDGRDAAVDYLKGAPDRFTKAAASVGSAVHDLFERLARGETLNRAETADEYVPYVLHFADFLEEFHPEFLYLEETIWSDSHGYAGSFDAIARIGGETVLLDWKTTRSGIHEDVALQMAAYRNADYILRANGDFDPLPKITGAAVLHVRPEGWKLVPVLTSEEVFAYFLTLKKVAEWERSVKKTVIGNPVNEAAKNGRRPRGRKDSDV